MSKLIMWNLLTLDGYFEGGEELGVGLARACLE
jgi:hypothetical protein